MPELPEVETVRRSLLPRVQGKTIEYVKVHTQKIIAPETVEHFEAVLKGQNIDTIKRLGKHLLFCLSDVTLLVHLRMEGKFYIEPSDVQKRKHEHVGVYFTDGSSMRFHDVRKFGTMRLKEHGDVYTTPPLSLLGKEPADPDFNGAYLKKRLNSIRAIKTALLDQHVVAGIGNIYADEILFCATIKPSRKAYRLSARACNRIAQCSKDILDKATALGGSSIRTYLSSVGITGKFQNQLNVHLREGKPCYKCGSIIKKVKLNGRGTYYCPTCQT